MSTADQTDLRTLVLEALADLAPEADLAALDPDEDFRDQLDLDSIDLLNLVVAVHDATGVDVPERDYPKMTTLTGAVAYLAAHAI